MFPTLSPLHSPSLPSHHPLASKMSKSLSATTPQLKAVDRFYEAYRTRDLKNAEPFMSKNFIYKTLPKSAKVPDLAKAEYLEKFGPMFASLAKLEVRIRPRTTLELTGLQKPHLAHFPPSD